jgi:hypothetical protein
MSLLNSQQEPESEDRFDLKRIKFNDWPTEYFFEEEYKLLNSSLKDKGTIYDKAMKMEIKGAYELDNLTPEVQLNRIKDEILIRTKITALEIFKIGGLLRLARRACRLGGIGYKEWIRTNFDFSYETANNFMNVFTQCLSMRSIAVKLPLSILYKISAPSFPDELRDYLFTQGNIDKMTNEDLSGLVEKYKEGGFNAIKENIDTWNHDYNAFRQTKFVVDRCTGILIDLRNLIKQINQKFGYYKAYSGNQERRELMPEANKVNKKLLDSLYSASSIIDKTIDEVDDILHGVICRADDSLRV